MDRIDMLLRAVGRIEGKIQELPELSRPVSHLEKMAVLAERRMGRRRGHVRLCLPGIVREVNCMLEFVAQHQFWAAMAIYTIHPGALNKADSAAYDTLLIAKTTIDQARLDYDGGQLPAEAKDALDALIRSYNIARASWLTYRGAASAHAPSTRKGRSNWQKGFD